MPTIRPRSKDIPHRNTQEARAFFAAFVSIRDGKRAGKPPVAGSAFASIETVGGGL